MLRPYQRRLLFCYLANAATRLDRRDPAAADLASWVADNAPVLDDEKPGEVVRRRRGRRERMANPDDPHLADDSWIGFQETLADKVRTAGRPRPDLMSQRLRRLAGITGMSATDIRILEVLLLYQTNPVVESVVDDVFMGGSRRAHFNMRDSALPYFLDMSHRAVAMRFTPGAPLVRSGLVSVDDDGDLELADRLTRLANLPGRDLDIRDILLGEPDRAALEWEDFEHVAEGRDHMEQLLRGTLRTGETGVNILLHGPPGTGKTELCRTMAARLGVPLFGVGERDARGGEPNRFERLGDLSLAQCLLSRDENALLLFDEMADLLPDPGWSLFFGAGGGRAAREGSKLFMNRLLEEAPVPTLWTANGGDGIPEVLLRRMKFALELRLPPPRIRARIWSRQLARNGIEARPGDALALATEFEAPPGVAAEVTAAARLSGGDIDSVRRGLRGLARALGCERPVQSVADRFDLALMRSDTDLVGLADRLAGGGERRFSLCLQGPPGTGKSACVRYFADRLALEVVQKRASDLLSPWVGGTERHIADAFQEARDSGAFLVFDEADSLLSDRRHAVRNWEVSQTNEMLTWMESHPLPFACTTNFADRLDAATLRRFVFKVALDYLAPGQAASAFRAFFGLDAPPDVSELASLTPGDFAVVRKKAEILRCLDDPAALAGMLREECDAKPERRRPIGFRA